MKLDSLIKNIALEFKKVKQLGYKIENELISVSLLNITQNWKQFKAM